MKSNNTTVFLTFCIVVLGFLFVFKYQQKAQNNSHNPNYSNYSDWEPIEEEKREYTLSEAINSISQDELRGYVYKLSDDDWEGRMSGKAGNRLAAEWIKKEFEKIGLQTMTDKFKINNLNPGPHNEVGDGYTSNVYGWIEGSDLKGEIVVIGAHMDHIGYGPSMSRTPNRREIHPGADDNASGTAALLEIAEALFLLKPRRTVVFQAYSAEEMGLIGSRFYCNNPKFPLSNPSIKKHVAMLNMDMIGHLNKGYYTSGFHDGSSSLDISKIINSLNEKYTFASKITSRGSGGSDHASFYNKKVPVAFIHTGGHAWYHTPHDTPDKLNYQGMEKVVKYAFELTWQLANGHQPEFNHAAFKEMSYEHDHGYKEMPFERSHNE